MRSYEKNETAKTQQIFSEILHKHPHDVALYTDASRSSSGVACAVVGNDLKHIYKLNDDTSVFTAELYSIKKAIQIIPTLTVNIRKAVICTDSLSSIVAINQMYSSNPIIQEIQETITKLKDKSVDIIIIWTPSHCDIQGNEEADFAARDGATSCQLVKTFLLANDLKAKYKNQLKQKWNRHWNLQATVLQTFEKTINRTTYTHLRRKDEVLLRRLRIGHTNITHNYLLNRTDQPICEVCNVTVNCGPHHIKGQEIYTRTAQPQHTRQQ
ncbi:hypothetical protein PPYR_09108 [Photinus pyralis]|uniref:RNase H type-1 domain-containing protein n=1 Tax=Photinus pyralis TaxID=7054 RepID=A0A5N4AL84_PHOPY|nr:hypothetical protein PPYR_09108 [Photinus pyralis]